MRMRIERFFAALACAMLLAALLPAAAFATELPVIIAGKGMMASATQSSYYVNGTDGEQGTVYTTEPAGGAWNAKLEQINGQFKLTIKNLHLKDTASGIRSNVDLHLHMDACTAASSIFINSNSTSPALDVAGNLLITAVLPKCRLELYSCVDDAVRTTGDLTYNAANPFYATTSMPGAAALSVGGDLVVEAGGILLCDTKNDTNATSRGIRTTGDVIMNGESLYALSSEDGIGLEAGGSIRLNSGNLSFRGRLRALNKAPDLSSHPAYLWATDLIDPITFHAMPYLYSETHTDVYIHNAPEPAPATGDGAHPALWLTLALTACAGLAASLALHRRRRQE